ncbi:MAG: (d)CMP kinase [Rhodothermales bacterium]
MIVAIDGPAGSGKSTTARAVARELGYVYLDTGALYRAVALAFLQTETDPYSQDAARHLRSQNIDVYYERGEMRLRLNGEEVSEKIRHPEVGKMASRVGTLPVVREMLVAQQRRIGKAYADAPGVVLEGRDIGTVVFPDADVKIFMVADPEVRARRRQAELAEQGTHVTQEQILAEIQQRDRQDVERTLSPLLKADDAVELNTTGCSFDEQVQFVIDRVRERERRSAV